MKPRRETHPLRVGLYGFFGMGNLGNEGSLAAFLAQLRVARPNASVCCFSADAKEVRRQHGIPGFRLMSYRATAGAAGSVVLARKALSRLWDIPRTAWLVWKVDVLVVPGTGVLESRLMSTPWGLPYWLFLTVSACRVLRRPVALVSVGAEPAPHPVTRLLMSLIVRMADYVTYRDAPSAFAAKSMGSAGRPGTVFPDLAFSLPAPPNVSARPGHVVVGVMTFLGGPGDRRSKRTVIDTYVENLAEVILRLCDRGRSVTVLVGDESDRELAYRIVQLVRDRRPLLSDKAIVASAAADLPELMREMARAEVVAASRFHNLICALNVARPTVSLGYARKNADLLRAFGLGRYSHLINAFDVDSVVADIEAAAAARPELQPLLEAEMGSLRRNLAEQTALLMETVLGAAPRETRSPATGVARRLLPWKERTSGQCPNTEHDAAGNVGEPVRRLHKQRPTHHGTDRSSHGPLEPAWSFSEHEQPAACGEKSADDVPGWITATDSTDFP
jgi:polysaccharide pyruvyl transferase WcaK-like protein